MVAWSEYKETAKSRGALALELYVVESTPEKGPDALKATIGDHLAYQRTMEDAGKLAFAGPLSDATGEHMQGNGMIVYRAASLEEARSLAENDPMHAQGVRSFTIRKWLVNEGSFSVTVGLSAGRVGME